MASASIPSNVTSEDHTVHDISQSIAASNDRNSSLANSATDNSPFSQAPSTTFPESTTTPTTASSDTVEDASPLEDGKFLSFEDWKRQNLQKTGQSEHVGKAPIVEHGESRKRPTTMHNTLDSLDDDAEIDLDFSGFVAHGPGAAVPSPPRDGDLIFDEQANGESSRPQARSRSKDAGTTCKERFNYASFDCAANVLKTNPEAKSVSAILGENKDSYMLNECAAENKFVILELCNDISIDTIVLANFEFFSSIFRTFRVSVSDKYPVKIDKWKTLGTFEARNSREVQVFLVENPVIWARYLRIEFLTHYGNEFYCPVSLVRVHGTTMLEEYKHDLESLQSDHEDDMEPEEEAAAVAAAVDVTGSRSAIADDGSVPEAIAESVLNDLEDVRMERSLKAKIHKFGSPEAPSRASSTLDNPTQRRVYSEEWSAPTSPSNISSLLEAFVDRNQTAEICLTDDDPSVASTIASSTTDQPAVKWEHHENGTGMVMLSSRHFGTSTNQTRPPQTTASNAAINYATAPGVQPSQTDSSTVTGSKNTADGQSQESFKPATSTQAHPAAPTMQESFFKSVQKRLQMLETNSSLSLQYIEEQSRALRDAFLKVERKQMDKTSAFLDHLNTTVLNELRDFRQQYDQLWQSTVIELEMQRERYQQEHVAINARLGVLADEVIFQKRLSILQMILILICLFLVLFSRGTLHSYLEMPLVQSVLSRSPSSRWLNLSNLDTPSQSPPMTRASSANGLRTRHGILKGHRRMQSEDSMDGTFSPTDMYSPPTPISYGEPSDGEQTKDGKRAEDPEFDPSSIERPSTSPPVLTGTVAPTTPELNGASPDASILDIPTPKLLVEEATPPKQLKWRLPET